MIRQSAHPFAPLLLALLAACSTAPAAEEKGAAAPTKLAASEVTVVELQPAARKVFTHQVEASGKVEALQFAELRFKHGGYLAQVPARNGQAVAAGQVLAALDPTDQTLALRRAEDQLALAQDAYIRAVTEYGGDHKKPDGGINPEINERLRARAGLRTAETEVELAKVALAHCQLRSPFAGTVADLQLKPGNFITPAQVACAVYSAGQLEVGLDVLEAELPLLRPGQRATVVPIGAGAQEYEATVADINPRVGTNGMLRAKLRVAAPAGLFPGMNVRATVHIPRHEALVVPRAAVVVRSGRKVVFTEEGGLAKWHYITTGLENTQEVEVTEGLQPGEKVVVANNLQLAHDSPVRVGGQ
jgi:RND family efflux transporter MFP subunit